MLFGLVMKPWGILALGFHNLSIGEFLLYARKRGLRDPSWWCFEA